MRSLSMPSLALSLFCSSLATVAFAGGSDPITLRKVSDEVFGDTGGTGGDGGHGELWAREVISASASAKSTGFSTVTRASPTATASPVASAASATDDGNLFSSATALPAEWIKDLENMSMTNKIALAALASVCVILLITTVIVCMRRRSHEVDDHDEVPPMAFDDRATTMPKSKHSYRRKSYRLFNENN